MLKRKVDKEIRAYLKAAPASNKMLVVEGARQVGKSYIIRHIGKELFPNFIEINMEEDRQHDRLFADIKTVEDFYLALSAVAGDKMGSRDDTLVFIDEIQAYDHLLTLVKFLMAEPRFSYIASGSLLGLALLRTQSIPIGSIETLKMYPLDFEEFLWANGVGELFISELNRFCRQGESPTEAVHEKCLDLFRRYLLVGGMPDAVNIYLAEHNIVKVRKVHSDIIELYKDDAAKYEMQSAKKLKIRRIYEMIPSNMENRKKRLVIKDIEGKTGKIAASYQEEFDYLVSAGIALEVDAISQPTYPLIQNAGKNLIKLYLCDVGLLTCILYGHNIQPILDNVKSVNLGAVYETVVAQELQAHGHRLFYYDNKKNGEVDFLIDDVEHMSSLPIEVKSGKDYKVHSALDRFVSNPDYNVKRAIVLSNERTVTEENDGRIRYLPVYDVMFLQPDPDLPTADLYF